MSTLHHQILIPLCVAAGLPKLIPEYRFHPTRRWEFDFALPEYLLAVEIEGGGWKNGRHNRESGRLKDREKYNAAAALRWRILYFTPTEVAKLSTIQTIKSAIS